MAWPPREEFWGARLARDSGANRQRRQGERQHLFDPSVRFLGRAIALGAAVYLLVLLVKAPASVLGHLLPDAIVLDDPSGSLWHGRAQGARVGEVAFGPITWDLNARRFAGLALNYRMSFEEPGLS